VVGGEPQHACGLEHGQGALDQIAMMALHVEDPAAEVGERRRVENAERPAPLAGKPQELVHSRAHQLSRSAVQL